MKQGLYLGVLLMISMPVFSTNPASTKYVDEKIAELQYQINHQYQVGQHALGGVIYFLYVDSAGNQHGLVSAMADEDGAFTWGSSLVPGTAQYQCANKNTGGYHDWITPTKPQITLLYTNRFAIDPTADNAGFVDDDTTSSNYWSAGVDLDSNGMPTTLAWTLNFVNGMLGQSDQMNGLSVRCIRSF